MKIDTDITISLNGIADAASEDDVAIRVERALHDNNLCQHHHKATNLSIQCESR